MSSQFSSTDFLSEIYDHVTSTFRTEYCNHEKTHPISAFRNIPYASTQRFEYARDPKAKDHKTSTAPRT